MAYEAPDTALHHLKMAKAYMDDAETSSGISKEASQFVSEVQLDSLMQAAEHLNKARAIDPEEVLWVDDEKEKTKVKYDQDYLNGRVLLMEGVAHLNASNDIWSYYKNADGKINKGRYQEGITLLEKGRDALEKAARYRPYSTEILGFLAKVYAGLGDNDNYRRVVEKHVQLAPDDMTLHKTMKDLNAGLTLSPSFDKPPVISFNAALALCIPAGILFGAIGGKTGIGFFFVLGVVLMLGPLAIWLVKTVWRENFG